MNKIKAIFLGGLVAGSLDIVYAFVVYGPLTYKLTPIQVLQSVAAGWIGREASREGGVGAAVLGLVTHFSLATLFAGLFVIAANRARLLVRRPLMSGSLYGLGLYVLMNYVVVPLSAAHASQHFPTDLHEVFLRLHVAFSAIRPTDPWQWAGTIFAHTVLVGMSIALINKRAQNMSRALVG